MYAIGELGGRVELRIHTHVREDALQLFGFATPLEQTLFERLISVSGIGPKVALAVLSGIEPAELMRAIRSSDVARLTRIPGVGKKTAERLVLELKDRLPEICRRGARHGRRRPRTPTCATICLSALANLGYQRGAVEKTVDKAIAASDDRRLRAAVARDAETAGGAVSGDARFPPDQRLAGRRRRAVRGGTAAADARATTSGRSAFART